MKQAERLPILKLRLNKLLGDMSVTEFAKKLGLSRQTVGFYLNGDRIPDSETLVQICKTCHVSSDWLLGLSNDSSVRPTAVDELGLSEEAIESIRKLDRFIYDDMTSFLSNIIASRAFPPLVLNMRTLFETIKTIKDLCYEGKIENLVDPALPIEIESTLSKILGYPARFVRPQDSIETDLTNIHIYAESIAKEVSGYYDFTKLLKQKLNKPDFLNASFTTLADIIEALYVSEYFDKNEEFTNAISQEENE